MCLLIALVFVLLLLGVDQSLCLASSPSSSPLPPPSSSSYSVKTLLSRAQSLVDDGNYNEAFGVLAQAYRRDPDAPGLPRLFEACLRLKVDSHVDSDGSSSNNSNEIQDRFGLAALLLDQERYEEASVELRHILTALSQQQRQQGKTQVDNNAILEKASSMLFRTNAACCQWESYVEDSKSLVDSLRLADRWSMTDDNDDNYNPNNVPAVHPFEALKWPCISLSQATQIAALYARRSMASTDTIGNTSNISNYATMLDERIQMPPTIAVSRETDAALVTNRKIRLGYISPDFTPKHPLAFLMQRVFGHHNRNQFEVKLYSLSRWDEEGSEVRNIQNGCDSFTVLPAESPHVLAKLLEDDELDVLVDLCGYAGTDRISQLLSLRPAPIQVSYMGFPASSGAPYLDYMVCDAIVVPPELRKYYTEQLIYMPHCYFVNSHATCVNIDIVVDNDDKRRQYLRDRYSLPRKAFVFCCHSRPDKIDPSTFRTWLQALKQVRSRRLAGEAMDADSSAVLWLLRSGLEMEANLLKIARDEFELDESALVFCDVAPREEHLQRLTCADLFLDTPAYNAHTLGCDALFAGVPMVTLLCLPSNPNNHFGPDSTTIDDPIMAESINTTDPLVCDTSKLASRVGASLLAAAGLGDNNGSGHDDEGNELICNNMKDYANIMVKCATHKEWFASIRNNLIQSRGGAQGESCCKAPLFDTRRWVENFGLALRRIVLDKPEGAADIVVLDSE